MNNNKSTTIGIIFVLLCFCAAIGLTSPSPDEEHYFDKEVCLILIWQKELKNHLKYSRIEK